MNKSLIASLLIIAGTASTAFGMTYSATIQATAPTTAPARATTTTATTNTSAAGTVKATNTETSVGSSGSGAGAGKVQMAASGTQEAQFDAFLKIDGVDGESKNGSSSKAKGNVEYTWKVEEGEKGGTEDINIGVGELQEASGSSTNGGGLKGGISVASGDVNGLTEDEKQTFLASVKAHAEVKSEQDLNNFAKGALLENQNMEEISLNYEKIKVKHRSNGKLLGFIPISFTQEIDVDTKADTGRVKIKMPWYSFLIWGNAVTTEKIEEGIGTTEKSVNNGTNDNWNFEAQAKILTQVSSIIKL